MTKLLMFLALLTIGSVPAHAEGLVYRSSQAVLVLGNAIDLAGSQAAIASGKGYEANKWLAQFERPLVAATVKTSTAVLTLYLTDKIHNRKIAGIANVAIGALFGGLGIYAERMVRK